MDLHITFSKLYFLLFTVVKLQAQRRTVLLCLISISLGPNGIPPPMCAALLLSDYLL